MRKIVVFLCGLISIAYVIYRAFTTFVILPLVAGPFSSQNLYFGFSILVAIGIAILSFTRHKGIAGTMAIVFGITTLVHWFLDVRRADPVWIWSDFVWFVVPEMFFVFAIICHWLVYRNSSSLLMSQAEE